MSADNQDTPVDSDPRMKPQQKYLRPIKTRLEGRISRHGRVQCWYEGCRPLAIGFCIGNSCLVGLIAVLLRPSDGLVAKWGEIRINTSGGQSVTENPVSTTVLCNFRLGRISAYQDCMLSDV